MKKFSIQEAFDIIVCGLRKQGRKSINHRGGCAIRGINNTKCAAGWLISDEDYKYIGESIPNVRALLKLSSEDKIFLDNMVNIHDVYPVENWEKHWAAIAKRFNLTILPLNETILIQTEIVVDLKPLVLAK